MEDRQATSVVTRYSTEGPNEGSHNAYEYVVGREIIVPSGEKKAVITEIRVVDSWRAHVEVVLEDWGSLWLTDYIVQIRFKDEQLRKIRSVEQAIKEAEDSGGGQEGLNKDAKADG